MAHDRTLNADSDAALAQALIWRYAVALVLVACLSTAAWLSLQWVISAQESTAAVVNVSGRQRMLSQRTALFANLLVQAPVEERAGIRSKLVEAVDLLERSHHGLIRGDASMGLPAAMSDAARALYFSGTSPLNSQIEHYVDAVRQLLRSPDAKLTADHPDMALITRTASGPLVQALDQAVLIYQQEGEAKVRHLLRAETTFWLLTLLLLGLEAVLIFHPFVNHVKRVINKLALASKDLQTHQAELEDRVACRTRELQERNTALEAAEVELRIAATAFNAQMGMTITDANKRILRVNRAFTEITGYTAAEAVGQTPHLLASGRHGPAFYQTMFSAIETDGMWAGEIWNRYKNGEIFPEWLTITAVKNKDEVVTHYVAAFTDISERKAAESQIRNLAFYDPLTNLPNRRLLMDRLELAMMNGARSELVSALLFIDLDNFKTINDTHGHTVGDNLLRQVAFVLRECVRSNDTVARLGGDEFVVMLESLSADANDAATQANAIGTKILQALDASYQLDAVQCHCTASIGVALFSGVTESIDDLIKRADMSMYEAKASGRNALRFFDPQIQAKLQAKAAVELALREAIEQRQFVLFYQAQVHADGRVAGAEALVRWQHPGRGLVSPTEFIGVAEQSGLILPLGAWVLETACLQLADWQHQTAFASLTLAVNVSAKQFSQPGFVDEVVAVLRRSGAPPQRLKLELTESLLVDDVDDVVAKMTALKTLGIGFSLDDFGTGYSSLAYLSRLPLDQLKIDQGFVRDIESSDEAAAICSATISLAHSLSMKVVAEGVETQAQLYFLNTVHHCDLIQGYLFSRPVPLSEFEQLARQPLKPKADSAA